MAHAAKYVCVISGLCEAVERRRLCPNDLQALLGHVQWFDLLNRPLFACLDAVYDFARSDNPQLASEMPDSVLGELLLTIALAPFWQADLTRQWLPQIVASDASVEFGFGVCYADCTVDVARSVGRLAEKRGDFVRLDREAGDEPERDRIGVPHRLGIAKSAFHTVLSAKKQYTAHSGALEATGVHQMLKWLLRSPSKQNHRIPALVDAKAVLGALAKGRSSSNTLKLEVRRISALTLAGNFLMKYVYIPSEDNPADAPSRGIKQRHSKKQYPVKQRNLKDALWKANGQRNALGERKLNLLRVPIWKVESDKRSAFINRRIWQLTQNSSGTTLVESLTSLTSSCSRPLSS